MDFKKYIQKLQNLPDNQKKIVLWSVVGILGLAMGIFWVEGTVDKLSRLGEEIGQINFIKTGSQDIFQK